MGAKNVCKKHASLRLQKETCLKFKFTIGSIVSGPGNSHKSCHLSQPGKLQFSANSPERKSKVVKTVNVRH